MSNFDLKKYLAEGRLLKEATFYQEMETINPRWNKRISYAQKFLKEYKA